MKNLKNEIAKRYPYFWDQKVAEEIRNQEPNATLVNKITGDKTRVYICTESESRKMCDDYTNYEINMVVENADDLRECKIAENMKFFDKTKFEAVLKELFGGFCKSYEQNEYPIILIMDDGSTYDSSNAKYIVYKF